jgi:hypothetical protein
VASRTAVLTMVYNEARRLPVWAGYYGRQFGDNALFLIDDGSDDNGLADFRGTILRRPRGAFDDAERAAFVSDYAAQLLRRFDAVIYVDCDEIIVPDLTKYRNLADYCAQSNAPVVRAAGFELLAMIDEDAPVDWRRPLLAQCRHARITHTLALFDPDLILCHFKLVDIDAALERQRLTRDLPWSAYALKNNFGARQRWSDRALLDAFRAAKAGRRAGCLSGTEAQVHFNQRGESQVALLPTWLVGAF